MYCKSVDFIQVYLSFPILSLELFIHACSVATFQVHIHLLPTIPIFNSLAQAKK